MSTILTLRHGGSLETRPSLLRRLQSGEDQERWWGDASEEAEEISNSWRAASFKRDTPVWPLRAGISSDIIFSVKRLTLPPKNRLAAVRRIYRRLRGARGIDEAGLWQHALYFSKTPDERCRISLQTAHSALSLKRFVKKTSAVS